jgi:hypothetical protein
MTGRSHRPARMAVVLTVVAVCASGSLSASDASALPGPGWELSTRTYPTNLPPGGGGMIEINVFNVGAADSNGTVTVTDTLPRGLTATDAGDILTLTDKIGHVAWDCAIGTTVVTCTNDPVGMPTLLGGGGPNGAVNSALNKDTGGPSKLAIAVDVSAEASGVQTNRVTVAGGGAQTPAVATEQVTISSASSDFRVAGWDALFSNEDGTLDTQAGSHPYEAIFSLDLASVNEAGSFFTAGGEIRNIAAELPPGFIGDPNAVPQCTRQQLSHENGKGGGCPRGSQIGLLDVTFGGGVQRLFRVFNMVPPPGVPAEFAIEIEGITTLFDNAVRTGSDYGITTHINNIPQRDIMSNTLILWGVPGDPSHDRWRGSREGCEEGCSVNATPTPFLTLPTACAGPQKFSISVNTWQHPDILAEASFLSHDSNGTPMGFTGCEHLGFAPTITTAPDTSQADTPAGLTVEVSPPVGGLLDPTGVGTSDVQNTTVTLPEGVVVNPGQAAGLVACQSSQTGVGTENPSSCPLASKVGTVAIETPLLKEKLEGNVYILQSNPPNLQLLLAAAGDGVNLKLIGNVHLDEATGRLTSTFSDTPAVPFTNLKLSFSGGAQAALATPATCGVYTTSSDFTPWSSPFVSDAFPTSAFSITSGPNGSACVSPLPFSPSMIAGSTTDQAGGFTNFSLLLQTGDGQQRISALQFNTPEGLLGMISKVPLCGEPAASQGTCPSASQIGHTVVASGPGPFPLVVPQPGQPPAPIYLTGPYKGAPYGLSIAVPVITGPFNLGTVVVRSAISVDRYTSRLTVTTDPLPLILDGVPTDLRTINAVIDRPGFMFNPTSCTPMSFSGTASSAQGTTAAISSPFQMGSCQSLKFKPDFRVSTSGKTSRTRGASLDARVLYPTGPLGANQASSQSNIAKVKVDLPKQLPSRLTTLQKACPDGVFNTNPAACPAPSRIGVVRAVTPVLPVSLMGPVYFVSHGGAKFPELIAALQGYGVTVYLRGETFINPAGITSSTFRQVPDVPIDSFELYLPQGPYSALAANGNLCTSNLRMPTVFTAQNGAVIHQNTKITVTGCGKAKASKAKKAKTARKAKRNRRTKR